jgi:hypothetical protein
LATEGIEYISGLYKIESESVDYTVEQRAERRQKESYPIILEFEQWLEDVLNKKPDYENGKKDVLELLPGNWGKSDKSL